MTSVQIFHSLVSVHIVTGALGLVIFWVPIVARKGGASHRVWGTRFVWLMLITGTVAVGISSSTIAAPVATHPHLMTHPDFGSADIIRGIFGWMMLYLAILTVNLAWYGRLCILHKRQHARHRSWDNLALQAILTIASANCLWQGYRIEQPLMMGISMVGFATVATNLHFLYRRKPGPLDWQLEHIKALVGAGISVYTAFFAFGAVRYVPALALTPILWSVPLITGLILIIYHQYKVRQRLKRRLA
ncbi:MAG: hypothetical protein AB8G17_02735 [Gammaproteobacteria bacterium]